jgi:aryl-alcohol dehydrogenase-like predicted oxidoreductase
VDSLILGRTELEVSVVGLGCGGPSRLGLKTGRGEAHATRLVEHAIERGITFIDTASSYGTEAVVGRAIRGRRRQVVLSTKAGITSGYRLASAAELAVSIENSLTRLDTDYIDVLHLHGVRPEDYAHCVDVLLPELHRQRAAGKIRFLGITEVFDRDPGHRVLRAAIPDDHFDVVMAGFNLLNQSARHTVFPAARDLRVGTLIMFAVRRALSRPEALSDLVAKLVADGHAGAAELDPDDPLGFVIGFPGVSSVVEAAYRFCRGEPGTDVILTGTGDQAHLDHNIEAILSPALPAALTARLHDLFGDVDTVSGN